MTTDATNEKLARIEADARLIKGALAEVGHALYGLSAPGRRPRDLGQIMAEHAGDEVRPDAQPLEVA